MVISGQSTKDEEWRKRHLCLKSPALLGTMVLSFKATMGSLYGQHLTWTSLTNSLLSGNDWFKTVQKCLWLRHLKHRSLYQLNAAARNSWKTLLNNSDRSSSPAMHYSPLPCTNVGRAPFEVGTSCQLISDSANADGKGLAMQIP